MTTRAIQNLTISTGTMIRFFLVLLGLLALYEVRDIIAALLFAVIVASALEPAIEWLKDRKIPRILGVILIYLAIAAAFFFVVYLIVPLFLEDFQSFSLTYPSLQKQLLSGFERVRTLPFFSFLDLNLEKLFLFPSEYVQSVGGGVLNFASSLFGGAFTLLLIIVFSFYLAAQERGIENFLHLVSPISHERYVVDIWSRSQRKLGRWLRAQLLLGVIVGVFIFLGLTFLGLHDALFFAFLAAIFEIVPVVGPILAAVPAVAAAFLSSSILGISVVILYTVVQQVESHVIVPVVMKKAVGLSPLIVVLALLAGLKLGGFFGILMAVPLTAIIAEFLDDWDKKKRALLPG